MAVAGVEELPLAGGHPALDLVNTVEPRFPTPDPTDHLRSPADLLTWARRAGLVDAAEAAEVAQRWARSPKAAAADLASSVRIREALFAVLSGDSVEVDVVAAHWAEAAAGTRLVPEGQHFRLAVAASIPDRLAMAAVDLLTGQALSRLRACPVSEGGCGWLFLDHSRNGSRRWCVMADCGAKSKSRRLTERRRAERAASRDS